ncbi:MAG: DUF4157 domain-containing protein [Actinomycetota bacterium]
MHRHDEPEPIEVGKRSSQTEAGLDLASQRAVARGTTDAIGPAQLRSLQRAAGNAGVAGLVEEDAGSSVRSVLSSGGGRPLDDDTRATMESQMGHDFSSVRVHTGSQASRSAEAVGASAYTVGDDVVFRDGQYNPSSDSGQRTIAHELTHVVQQRQGPVEGTDTGTGVKVSDPSDRFEREAEANADAVMGGGAAIEPAQRSTGDTAVQREGAMEEEEELQAQRQAEGEDEEELQMQRQGGPEEEEELQAQREATGEDEEELQMQRQGGPEEEEELQMERQGSAAS